MKANCRTPGHVLAAPPTIWRTSVVAVMLPSGLRLVPATLAHWQADTAFSPPPQFDWQLHWKAERIPINRLRQGRPEHKRRDFDLMRCFTRCISCSTPETPLLKGDLVTAAGKRGSCISSCRYDELKVSSLKARPLSSTLLFLFLTPCLRQRARDEKWLYTSGWFKRRSDNKALWLLASLHGSMKSFDMRNNVRVCQREKEKNKGKGMKESRLMSATVWGCLM